MQKRIAAEVSCIGIAFAAEYISYDVKVPVPDKDGLYRSIAPQETYVENPWLQCVLGFGTNKFDTSIPSSGDQPDNNNSTEIKENNDATEICLLNSRDAGVDNPHST